MKSMKFASIFIISAVLMTVLFVFFSFFGKEIIANKLINYAQTQNSKQATTYYDIALKLSPENATARNDLVEIYIENGDFALALSEINDGILQNPDNDNLYFYKVKLLEQSLEIEQAIDLVNSVDSAYVNSKFSEKIEIEPSFNVSSGIFNENVQIVIETKQKATIYYKINAEKYQIYQNSFELSDGFYDIKAVAIDEKGLLSSTAQVEIFVENLAAPVSFSTSQTIDAIQNQIGTDGEIDRDGLQSLVEIDLSDSVLFDLDIQTLLNCSSLKTLKLGDISNISSLETLTKLSELSEVSVASGCTQSVLAEILQINSLDVLEIKNSKINVLPENQTLLTSLTLENCLIYDISNISSYKTLVYLDLSQNAIYDISALEKLKKINFLDLSNNKISNISCLFSTISLKSLNVSENQISNIKNISNLSFLEQVNISHNEVATVLEFANLRYLTTLNCSFNNILTLEPLISSQSLQEIYANDNNIGDISYLSQIENLTYINVSNNNL